MQFEVQAYSVRCRLHSYKDDQGKVHHCQKCISVSQPNEEVVRTRLRAWVLHGQGLQALDFFVQNFSPGLALTNHLDMTRLSGLRMVPGENESREELRRRHVYWATQRALIVLGCSAEDHLIDGLISRDARRVSHQINKRLTETPPTDSAALGPNAECLGQAFCSVVGNSHICPQTKTNSSGLNVTSTPWQKSSLLNRLQTPHRHLL